MILFAAEDFTQYLNTLCCYSLLEQVLSRFEEEGNAELLKATLCLIEVSRRGLLETELIYILGGFYFSKLKGKTLLSIWKMIRFRVHKNLTYLQNQ